MSQKPPQISPVIRQKNSPSVRSNSSSGILSAISSATSIDQMIGDEMVSGAFTTIAYHELLENPHVEIDGLQRLQENLAQLEDLHGRLQFMMRDITRLIR